MTTDKGGSIPEDGELYQLSELFKTFGILQE